MALTPVRKISVAVSVAVQSPTAKGGRGGEERVLSQGRRRGREGQAAGCTWEGGHHDGDHGEYPHDEPDGIQARLQRHFQGLGHAPAAHCSRVLTRISSLLPSLLPLPPCHPVSDPNSLANDDDDGDSDDDDNDDDSE